MYVMLNRMGLILDSSLTKQDSRKMVVSRLLSKLHTNVETFKIRIVFGFN